MSQPPRMTPHHARLWRAFVALEQAAQAVCDRFTGCAGQPAEVFELRDLLAASRPKGPAVECTCFYAQLNPAADHTCSALCGCTCNEIPTS